MEHFRTQIPGRFPVSALAGALIRQGDYLVGVTVTGGDADAATALAAEVADKTAANLAFLDPVHGGE